MEALLRRVIDHDRELSNSKPVSVSKAASVDMDQRNARNKSAFIFSMRAQKLVVLWLRQRLLARFV